MPSSVYMSTIPASAQIPTLSLHDALPISVHHGAETPPRDADDVLLRLRLRGRRPLRRRRLLEQRVDGKRSEEHTSELQSLRHLVCRLLLEKKKGHSLRLIQRVVLLEDN